MSLRDYIRRKRHPSPTPPPAVGSSAPAATTPAGGSSAPAATTGGGSSAPAPAAASLSPAEKRSLVKMKTSSFQDLVNKVGAASAPAPEYTASPSRLKTAKAVGSPLLEGAEGMGDTAGGTLDLADSVTSVADITEGVHKLPVFAAVFDSVKALATIGGHIKEVVEICMESRKGKISMSEAAQTAKGSLDAVLAAATAAKSIMSVFESMGKAVPIVGAVIGCITGAIGFVTDAWSVFKSSRNVNRMSKQKEDAKKAVKDKQGAEQFVVERSSRLDPKGLFGARLHLDKRFFEDTGTGRKKRLDEKTGEMRAAGGQDELAEALEEYDVTKELKGANVKRLRESLMSVVFDDAAAVLTSLLRLDPQAGSAVGGGIDMAIAAGKTVKTAVTGVRRLGRNRGWAGFDQNKSDMEKKKRRHHLAVTTFNRLKSLHTDSNLGPISENTTDPTEVDKVQTALPRYKVMSDRITAMGVGYGPLLRAADGDEMVEIMRQGFFRDSG